MKKKVNDTFYESLPYSRREKIKELLAKGANPNHPLPDGRTPLIRAARWNSDPGIIHTLVDHGAEVNARDQEGRTALLWAAAKNKNPGVLDALITLGADVTATSLKGETALDLARQNTYLQNSSVIDRLRSPKRRVRPPGTITGSGNGYALLIGINHYAHSGFSPLKYAENDARELGRLLQEICGFQTRCLLGPAALSEHFNQIIEEKRLSPQLPRFKSSDRFFLFFAGHGELIEGEYLLHLYQASPHTVNSSLHLDQLIKLLQFSIPCTQCMTVLDACRNITVKGMRGSSPQAFLSSRDVKVLSAPCHGKTIKTLFGCKEKGVSWEDDRLQHGVLTFYLKQALEKMQHQPVITFEDLVEQASDLMRTWQHWDNPEYRQEPYFYHIPSLERIRLRSEL